MKYEIVKLCFKSPLHLGEKETILEDTSNIIHSDTLFSSVCYAWRALYGKNSLEELLLTFLDKPPFLISSSFPFYDDVLFFPLPYNFQAPDDEAKNFKRVKFIPFKLFEDIKQKRHFNLDEYILLQDKLALLPVERKNSQSEDDLYFWKEKEVQRVTLDRINSSSNLFNFRELHFQPNCGFYFIIDYKDNSIAKKLKASLRLLGDAGLGGDRGSGKGIFKVRFEYLEIDDDIENAYQLLSLYYPAETERPLSPAQYGYKTRGGFVYSFDETSRRKKYVRMFTEGSIFNGRKPQGELVDITPEGFDKHKVYRYGYAFCLGIKA
ncbi:MAG: hypothetical protein DDT41_01340 [candidate division WS2 bacterium]|nr:hypothetical protein [Candidatus Psychracetigena formicireducens]